MQRRCTLVGGWNVYCRGLHGAAFSNTSPTFVSNAAHLRNTTCGLPAHLGPLKQFHNNKIEIHNNKIGLYIHAHLISHWDDREVKVTFNIW